MPLDPLEALSPVDGRYARSAYDLRAIVSEAALIRERVRIECEWLLRLNDERQALGEIGALHGAGLPEAVLVRARELAVAPPEGCAAQIKGIEQRTNHDVKAVEYWIREQLASVGATAAVLELVHFGCTSEDINNLAYARMLRRARELMSAELDVLATTLGTFAVEHADLPMLSRTHGQPASPTTLGKEFANVCARLERATARWRALPVLGKWNGAVGNFNAHHFAVPGADWPAIARRFVESQGLAYNPLTTQIEPHDWIGDYCDALARANVVMLDFARDCWGYISLGYLRQRPIEGEVGSSTMPHKVNPIDFENAEGNLGVANALLQHFSVKLPVSRWQRDLSDSTVLRSLGVALAHSLIAWRSLKRGLDKLAPDPARLAADLDNAWEVLGEAVQTVLRAAGVPDGYERLKAATRGRPIDRSGLVALVGSLPLPEDARSRLVALSPAGYLGLAAALARRDAT